MAVWIESKIVGNCSLDIMNRNILVDLVGGSAIIESDSGKCFIQMGNRAILIECSYDKIKKIIGKKEIHEAAAQSNSD